MTHPMAIHRFEDNEAIDLPPGGDVVEGGAGAGVPDLAAIQRGYEEAKASIVDPAPSSPSAADGEDPLPATERIDVRTVALPVVPSPARGTAAMSVAARYLAEQIVVEEMRPASGRDAGPERGTTPPGPRGWWRALRTTVRGAVFPAGPES